MQNLDARDLVGIAGLALLGAGCALLSVPLALVVVGALLLGMAIFPSIHKRGGD